MDFTLYPDSCSLAEQYEGGFAGEEDTVMYTTFDTLYCYWCSLLLHSILFYCLCTLLLKVYTLHSYLLCIVQAHCVTASSVKLLYFYRIP